MSTVSTSVNPINFSEKARTTTVKNANIKAALYYQWGTPQVNGKTRMAYKVWYKGKLLFSGNDFFPGMFTCIDSKEAIMSLLAFIAIGPDDIEESYFDNYTPEQLAFASSYDAELLGYAVSDYEERQSSKR